MRPPCPTGKLAEETAPAVSSSQVPLTIFFHTNSSPGRRFPSLSRRDCDLHAPQGNSRKKPPQRFLLPRFLSRFSFIRTHLLGDVSRACLGGIAISMPHRETRGRNRPSGFFFPGSSHVFLSYELTSWATFPGPAWAGLRPPCPTGKLAEETAPAVSSSQVPLTFFFHENGLSLAKPRGSWQRTHLSAERNLFPSFLQEKSKELRVLPRSKSRLF